MTFIVDVLERIVGLVSWESLNRFRIYRDDFENINGQLRSDRVAHIDTINTPWIYLHGMLHRSCRRTAHCFHLSIICYYPGVRVRVRVRMVESHHPWGIMDHELGNP